MASPPSGDSRQASLRALCVLANPTDLPRFDDVRLWRDIDTALQPFRERGSVAYERLAEPTERGLRKSLEQGTWHVLHLIVHAQERSSAHYGTVALQSSDGCARNLTAAYVAEWLATVPSLKLVVLQGCDDSSACFDTMAEALLQQGVPAVVTARPLYGNAPQIFLAKLYAGLLLGLSADGLAKEFATALPADGSVRVLSRNGGLPILATAYVQAAAAAPAAEVTSSAATVMQAPSEAAWHEVLKRKRAAGQFDVFLCHNSADKPAVKRIGQQLKEAGILPWLDVWELPPGQPWQPLLEQQIGNIRSAAVCFGSAGIGPWQEQEMYGFLREFVSRRAPVIPLLLPDAPLTPELPIFLRAMTWVDFRRDDPDPFKELIWGITGERPDD